MRGGIVVFSGSSHVEFAMAIVSRLGVPLGDLSLAKFANLEIGVEIRQSVRDQDVYIVQTSYGNVNDYLMELLILIHACKIASAARGMPNMHIPTPTEKPLKQPLNEHQEEMLQLFKDASRTGNGYRTWAARSGRLVASMIEAAGADHVIAIDLHSAQYQGFFNIPLDNLPASPLMIKYLKEHIPNYENAIVVSPDAGGAKRASELASLLGVDFALIHKDRALQDSEESTLVLVGNVQGRDAIIMDDMADTSLTLTYGAALLKKHGARRIYAAITHGIFSGDSVERIYSSDITEVIVSNTVPQQEHIKSCPKFRVFDVSPIVAEAIRRTHNGESISYLFSPDAFQ